MQDVYQNVENYIQEKENKILIVFDDMIADMTKTKKINAIVIELFTRCRKLNISVTFITQSILKYQKKLD